MIITVDLPFMSYQVSPEQALESAGRLALDGDHLVVREDGSRWAITPAVRFMSVLSGDDIDSLVGKVYSIADLAQWGAEHVRDSVLRGDAAYQVEEGFLGNRTLGAEASEGDLFAAFLSDEP